MREHAWTVLAIAAAILFALAFAALASVTGWNSTLVFGIGLVIGIAGLNAVQKIRKGPRKRR
jgi:flagellar basal body P-ring protein FlgI